MRGQVAPGHRPVTLTGQFVRVAKPGRLDVEIETIKQGGTALFMVTLAQGGQPVFLAQVWTTARSDASRLTPHASHPTQPAAAKSHKINVLWEN